MSKKKDLQKQIKSNYGTEPKEKDFKYPHGGRDAIYDFTFYLDDNLPEDCGFKLIEHDMMIGEILSIDYHGIVQVHLTLDWFDDKVTIQIFDKGEGYQAKGSMSDLFVKPNKIDFFTNNDYVISIDHRGVFINKLREDDDDIEISK